MKTSLDSSVVATTIEMSSKSLTAPAEEDFSKATINPESHKVVEKKLKMMPLEHGRLHTLVLEAAATASTLQLHTTVAVITCCKAGDLDSV